MKKIILICLIVCSVPISCKRTLTDLLNEIETIVRKSDFVYKDYVISDFRESAYYIVTHKDRRYIARMPQKLDTLLVLSFLPDSLKQLNRPGKNLAEMLPTNSEEAVEIKNACLLFRSIWQVSPQSVYLKRLETDNEGNVLLSIEEKKTKRDYSIYISKNHNKI